MCLNNNIYIYIFFFEIAPKFIYEIVESLKIPKHILDISNIVKTIRQANDYK